MSRFLPFFRVFSGFFFLALVWGSFCSPAQAALLFCNQANVTIEAAFGMRADGVWSSEGWWRIDPHNCARIISNPLKERFYFYYARALGESPAKGKKPKVWEGKYNFCVDKAIFHIEGDQHCARRGYVQRGFREVDVGVHQENYTVTFK